MPEPKKLYFTITADPNNDQRMIRICSSLAEAGYEVVLVSCKRIPDHAIHKKPYKQVQLPVLAQRGPIFYLSYWLVLFFYLLFRRADVLCAIDLDTILPVLWVSKIKGTKRVYDAHEIFTEMKEVVTRPRMAKFWNWVADHSISQFPKGYTVGDHCAIYLNKKYGVRYPVITNATLLRPLGSLPDRNTAPFILYQGAVNKGRCFEELIPAMQWVNMPLVVCGQGNFWEEARTLAAKYKVEDKIIFKGWVAPEDLWQITRQATIGLILLDDVSKNNVYSLANRVFDYMHNAVPQLSMNFPEYKTINDKFEIALLLDAPLTPESIAKGINELLGDKVRYERLLQNSLKARLYYNWQENEKQLISFYKELLN